MEKDVFVNVLGGEESHDVMLLDTMCCSRSLVYVVLHWYCNMIADDFIKHSQLSSMSSIFQCGRQISSLMAVSLALRR